MFHSFPAACVPHCLKETHCNPSHYIIFVSAVNSIRKSSVCFVMYIAYDPCVRACQSGNVRKRNGVCNTSHCSVLIHSPLSSKKWKARLSCHPAFLTTPQPDIRLLRNIAGRHQDVARTKIHNYQQLTENKYSRNHLSGLRFPTV